MRIASLLALVVLAGWCESIDAQHYPRIVALRGQPTPDGLSTYIQLWYPNVNDSGVIAFPARDASIDSDILVVGGQVLLRKGQVVPGTGGTLNSINSFQNTRQINTTGSVVVEVSSLGGVSSFEDNAILVDGMMRLQEGAPVGGVPGRTFAEFAVPSITDGGDVYLRIDMSGSTSDDEAVYVSYSSGGGEILPMSATSRFREGTPIQSGPLQGAAWGRSPSFERCRANGIGSLLVSGILQVGGSTTTSNDYVLVRKRASLDYELVGREGETFDTPVSGSGIALSTFGQLSIASSDDWAALVGLLVTQTGSGANEAVIASIGGGAPFVVVQEGQLVSSATGVPGTTLGDIQRVEINGNGKILVLAGVQGAPTDPISYDEALLLWDGGSLELVLADDAALPEVPGQSIGESTIDGIVLNDQDRVFFRALLEPLSDWSGVFEVIPVSIPPITTISCVQSGPQAIASWSLPPGGAYDGIRVLRDGAVEQVLAGTSTTWTSPSFTASAYTLISVVPFVGSDDAPPTGCFVSVALPPDFEQCSIPSPPTPIAHGAAFEDALSFSPNVLIEDVAVSLHITHTSQEDLEVSIRSPFGTEVGLFSDIGGSLDNVDITFADFGALMVATSDLGAGGYAHPEGPGTMADFECELAGGDWALSVFDDLGGNYGTLDSWCLQIYTNPVPGPDCCPPRTDLLCYNIGTCGGPAVALHWDLSFAYAALEIVRTMGANQLTIPLAPSATSLIDTGVTIGADYSYTLRYICAPGGALLESGTCSLAVNVNTVPGVIDLMCTADPCGSGTVELTWTDAAPYDLVELYRAGIFLANVTGQSGFVDAAPLAGVTSYSVVGHCLGVSGASNCSADTSLPEIAQFQSIPDYCAGEVHLTWNIGTAPYTGLILERDGSFLADVTGATSFTDNGLVWGSGSTTYSLIGVCGAFSTPPESRVVDLDFQVPSSFACSCDLGTDEIVVSWISPTAYSSIEISRDGVPIAQPSPTSSTFVDSGLAAGYHIYTILFSCLGASGSVQCAAEVIPGREYLLIGHDDIIGGVDGATIHDPNTGEFISDRFREFFANEIYLPVNAILGPREPGGETVVYLSDSPGTSNGGLVRFRLDGGFLGQYIDDALYDDVRGIEFQGDTLYLTSVVNNVVAAVDIGTGTSSPFIFVGAPADLLFLPSGDLLVGSQWADTVILYDSTGDNPVVVANVVNPNQIAALSNGNFVVASENGVASAIVEFSISAGVVASYPVGFPVKGVHELPNGSILFTSSMGNGLYTLERTTGQVASIASPSTDDLYYIERVQLGPPVPLVEFVRGDCNDDGGTNIADAIFLLGYLFPGAGAPNVLDCRDAADASDDEAIDIGDAISILGALFGSPAVPLPPPGPAGDCGQDPSGSILLDCARYGSCP